MSKAQQDIRRKTRVLEHAARTGNVRPNSWITDYLGALTEKRPRPNRETACPAKPEIP